MCAGGSSYGGSSGSYSMNNTEEYDGTSWSAGGALSTAVKYQGGAGSSTAGLSMGGEDGGGTNDGNTNKTEEYHKPQLTWNRI